MDKTLETVRIVRDDEDEDELIELAPEETSLTLLQKIYRSVRQPIARRMRAAEQALKFEHPALGVMASTTLSANDFAAMLDRAIARSGKAAELAIDVTPKQIESD